MATTDAVRRRIAAAFAADVVSIVLFTAIGRRNHDEGGNAVTGALGVAAPFLVALLVGWLVARAWKAPTAAPTGMVIWVVTVALGMVLRHFAWDRGTATAFIIVASVFTLLFLVGWRLLWEWRASRR